MYYKIIFCSENENKYLEYKNILSNLNYNNIELIRWYPNIEIEEIQSLERNKIVLKKLNDYFTQFHLEYNLYKFNDIKLEIENENSNIEYWLIVEDTSFCIDNMNGFPGPLIKFYLNSVPDWKICFMNTYSKAQSIVSLGFGKIKYSKDMNNIYLGYQNSLEGIIYGKISDRPKGINGFGYDSIFIPNIENNVEGNKTYAEMTIEEKNKYNARLLVLKNIIKYIFIY